MGNWLLVAAVLQGGVWQPGASIDKPDYIFQTEQACEIEQTRRARQLAGDFVRLECVELGERHSLLPLHIPGSAAKPDS